MPMRASLDPKADWPAAALPLIQLFFWDARRRLGSFPHAQAAAGGKQRAAGGRDRGEPDQAGPRHIDVDRLNLAAAEVVSCQKPVPPLSRRNCCHHCRCGKDRAHRSRESKSRQY